MKHSTFYLLLIHSPPLIRFPFYSTLNRKWLSGKIITREWCVRKKEFMFDLLSLTSIVHSSSYISRIASSFFISLPFWPKGVRTFFQSKFYVMKFSHVLMTQFEFFPIFLNVIKQRFFMLIMTECVTKEIRKMGCGG